MVRVFNPNHYDNICRFLIKKVHYFKIRFTNASERLGLASK